MTRKNEKQNNLVKIVLLLLLYMGVILICFPLLKNIVLVDRTTTATVSEVSKYSEISKIPFERIEAPSLSEIMTSTNDLKSVGAIQVPSVDIELPVFAGLSQEELIYGAGAMYPERDPGTNNMILLGHHVGVSDLLFGKLMDVKVGAVVYLRYLSHYYSYQITTKKMVKETEIQILEDTTQPLLTLVTCDRGTKTENRLVITAVPVKRAPSKIKVQMTNYTKIAETQIQQLRFRRIWLPLSLIMLCLLLATYFILKKV